MSGQAGRYQRSAAGMVAAMFVLVLVVIGWVLFREAVREVPETPVRTVDYVQVADSAREQASFDVLAPEELPEGWRATSARFTPGRTESWHLGMLTDEQEYVGLEQSGASVDDMVEEHVDAEAVEGKSVEVAGETWQTWRDAGGDLALVQESGDTTTLVVGHGVPQPTLADFVERLR
jgi:hypothetical protein